MKNYKVNNCIICYFDILGYKQMLQKLGDDIYIHYIDCVMDAIKTVLQFDGFKYHIFSDNIIIFVPIKEKHENMIVISECVKCLSLLQRNLIGQYSVFIRGCITIGNIYSGGDFVFGSGLIKAYTLENEVAVYPRIILDKECIELFDNENELLWEIFRNAYVQKDVDGCFFLNYLFNIKSSVINMEKGENNFLIDAVDTVDTSKYIELPNPFSNINFSDDKEIQMLLGKYQMEFSRIWLNYLLLHKIIVERNIIIAKDEKIRRKYIWCKDYHNKVCKAYGIPELFISN